MEIPMKYSTRTRLALLAASALMVGVVSTVWWLASPASIRRTGEAMVLLVCAICCIQECRRMPVRSPLVLCTTLIGLVAVLFTRRAGPVFPTTVVVLVVLAWAGVALARMVAWYRRPPGRRARGNVPVRVAMDER
jgi:hypothetical protein